MGRIKALEVAQWFYNNNETVRYSNLDAHMKLQKLVYYSQAMYSAVYDEKLYNERIEAWENGPVIRSVYVQKRYEENNFMQKSDDELNLDDDIIKVLNVVNSVYGTLSANELVDLSHQEMPWKELEEKVKNRSNPEIKFDRINEFYSGLIDIYEAYEDFNFENEAVELINGNNFCYMTDNIECLTEDEKIELFEIGLKSRGNTFTVSRVKYGEESKLVVY